MKRIRKGIAYFTTLAEAQNVAEAIRTTTDNQDPHIRNFGLGFAVQYYTSGPYYPELEQNNCDGAGPHASGEVRVLPHGAEPSHGNSILCRACFDKEISWRRDMNRATALVPPAYDLPQWTELVVYGAE